MRRVAPGWPDASGLIRRKSWLPSLSSPQRCKAQEPSPRKHWPPPEIGPGGLKHFLILAAE